MQVDNVGEMFGMRDRGLWAFRHSRILPARWTATGLFGFHRACQIAGWEDEWPRVLRPGYQSCSRCCELNCADIGNTHLMKATNAKSHVLLEARRILVVSPKARSYRIGLHHSLCLHMSSWTMARRTVIEGGRSRAVRLDSRYSIGHHSQLAEAGIPIIAANNNIIAVRPSNTTKVQAFSASARVK